jgi:hypothetical protein
MDLRRTMTYVKTTSNLLRHQQTKTCTNKSQALLYVLKMKAAYLFERLEPTYYTTGRHICKPKVHIHRRQYVVSDLNEVQRFINP